MLFICSPASDAFNLRLKKRRSGIEGRKRADE
jgi:hypothetical protein